MTDDADRANRELGEGRIKQATGYWGAPFAARDARSAFMDPD